MNPSDPQTWLDRLEAPLVVLTYVVEIVGVVGIFLAIWLLLKASPARTRKAPRR